MTMLPAQGTAWRRVELPDVPPPPDPQEVARRDADRARLKAEFDAIDWDVAQAATFERIRDPAPSRRSARPGTRCSSIAPIPTATRERPRSASGSIIRSSI